MGQFLKFLTFLRKDRFFRVKKAVEQNFRTDIRNLRKKLTQNPLLKLIVVQTREPVKLMSQGIIFTLVISRLRCVRRIK